MKKPRLFIVLTMIIIFCTTFIIYDSKKNLKIADHQFKVKEYDVVMGSKVEVDKSKIEVKNKTVKLIPYEGKINHIFFHPLVAYNKRAFDGDGQAQGMDDWFITAKEFKEILKQLYKNNYILVNINDIYEEVQQGSEKIMKRKELLLPESKKPLIISIDDLNYYEYMIKDGTVSKLIIDNDGKVATLSKDYNGREVVSRDNEIIPILDDFVEVNPDFSLNNAKGTIALTGYEGILGYRTNRQNPNKDEEKKEAIKIVNKLKETGWNFASHSYGHPNMSQSSYNKVVDDTNKWINEVESIVGQTQVYIYPFGAGFKATDSRFRFLQQQGFKIFCGVGPISYEEILSNGVITDRRHCDGISLRNQRKEFLDLYDGNMILDIQGRKGID